MEVFLAASQIMKLVRFPRRPKRKIEIQVEIVKVKQVGGTKKACKCSCVSLRSIGKKSDQVDKQPSEDSL
jgi:hypothetical protein